MEPIWRVLEWASSEANSNVVRTLIAVLGVPPALWAIYLVIEEIKKRSREKPSEVFLVIYDRDNNVFNPMKLGFLPDSRLGKLISDIIEIIQQGYNRRINADISCYSLYSWYLKRINPGLLVAKTPYPYVVFAVSGNPPLGTAEEAKRLLQGIHRNTLDNWLKGHQRISSLSDLRT